MPIPVIMPKLEMSQETALVQEWLKKEGDLVQQGEALLQVETDKLSTEVEAPASGILAGILVKENDVVPVTEIIAYLLQAGETLQDIPTRQKAIEPQLSSAKVETTNKPSRREITPLALRMAQKEGINLAELQAGAEQKQITRKDVELILNQRKNSRGKVRATPAARRLGKEANINLAGIMGSGPRGRVQAADLQNYQPAMLESNGEGERIPFQGMRRVIADRLQASYQTAPHIYFTTTIDMTALESLRKALNNRKNNPELPHISVTALLTKYIARVIVNFPIVNSSLREGYIQLNQPVHVGIAVALKNGLIVPVVKHAETKTVDQIAREIADLSARAHAAALTPSDVAEGTFTISNLGTFGIEQFTAILNPGQTAIVAVGAIIATPVVIDQQVIIRPMMKMTLAVDHRVVDGAVAAHFMKDLKTLLENPAFSDSM